MNRCALFLAGLLLVAGCAQTEQAVPTEPGPPNFVIIFCDDLGYGDVGAFGHPTIRTPELDRMAAEGQRWTSFYVGASVCTPSRAALMTGRLPIRSGMCSDRRRVLFPDSGGGLPSEEVTIAEALKDQGYTTACVGKWHLGHLPQFLPTANGFDYYFGIPYSNDMDRVSGSPDGRAAFLNPHSEFWNVPILRNAEVIERPADQRTITRHYTEEAVKFIKANREKPFFLYLAHSMPHVPLFRSDAFADTSRRGLFGDVIEEIDWSVGEVLQTLRELQLEQKTLVVFSSDNGPWLSYDQQGGSAGLLRGGKGGTFEGGMREPTIFWWPGAVEPGVVASMGATMDILPTFLDLAGTEPPSDRVMDGYSLEPALKGSGTLERNEVLYYRGTEIYAVRKGPFKAHFVTKSEYGGEDPVRHDPPLLYHLEHDPSEKYNVAEDNPDVLADIDVFVEAHKATIDPVPDQLAIRLE